MSACDKTSSSDSTIGLDVDVDMDALSNIFINIYGSGKHSVMLDVVAQELSSVITLDGPDTKSVNATVYAAGKSVSQDLNCWEVL